MLIFLTPHVIDDESDLEEVYRVKVAQRQEFIKRFYGKSRDDREREMKSLLSYSMNHIDQSSRYRGNQDNQGKWQVIGTESDNQKVERQENDASETASPEKANEDVTEKVNEMSEETGNTESSDTNTSSDVESTESTDDQPIRIPSDSETPPDTTDEPSE